MTTPTTNFAWPKPIIGADSDTWGTELNTIFDDIDGQVFLYLLKTGGTVSGALTLGSTLAVTGAATFSGGQHGGTFEQDSVTSGTWYTVLTAAQLTALSAKGCRVRVGLFTNFNVASGPAWVDFGWNAQGAGANRPSIGTLFGNTTDFGVQFDGSQNFQIKSNQNTSNLYAAWDALVF